MTLDLDFIAGFIDADGSLGLGLEKRSSKSFTRRLKVTISNNDKDVLDMVQKTLKYGSVTADRNGFAFNCRDREHISEFIKQFESRFHGSVKIEMPILTEALRLCEDGQSILNHAKFVHLMFESNSKGALRKHSKQYWLDSLAGTGETAYVVPDYVSEIRKKGLASKPMTGQYVSGYTQGDGGFSLPAKSRKQANFTLTEPEPALLYEIQQFFGFSPETVFPVDPKSADVNEPCYRLQMDRTKVSKDLILPHYDKFPVHGNQAKRYSLYKQGVLLLAGKEKNYIEKFKVIADKLKNL